MKTREQLEALAKTEAAFSIGVSPPIGTSASLQKAQEQAHAKFTTPTYFAQWTDNQQIISYADYIALGGVGKTPPIGQVVLVHDGKGWVKDWVAQVRVGDEQSVLMWGAQNIRHTAGTDSWVEDGFFEDLIFCPVETLTQAEKHMELILGYWSDVYGAYLFAETIHQIPPNNRHRLWVVDSYGSLSKMLGSAIRYI